MSKPKFDPSLFEVKFNNVYYDGVKIYHYEYGTGHVLNKRLYNKYIQYNNGTVTKSRIIHRVSSISSQYSKYFSPQTNFKTAQGGHLASWAKPLSLRGGANGNYNWGRPQYWGFGTGNQSKIFKLRTSSSGSSWGANINSNAGGTVLAGTSQWIQHLRITLYALYKNAENWRVLVGQRAIKVFQNSFRYRQFYSSRTQHWRTLSEYTLRKRAHRGTGSAILREYGDLLGSFRLKERVNMMTTRVYTDVVPADSAKHKKHSICYAGYHNEGKGTYGKGWNGQRPKPYIKRQFMGHSSHLDPYKDTFMRKMMKIYLFDSVFLAKKA